MSLFPAAHRILFGKGAEREGRPGTVAEDWSGGEKRLKGDKNTSSGS